jgi:hypothetical protein
METLMPQTASRNLTEHPEVLTPAAERALHWARQWYPGGSYSLAGATEREANVLIEIEGDIRIIRYRHLDGRCPVCGASLI